MIAYHPPQPRPPSTHHPVRETLGQEERDEEVVGEGPGDARDGYHGCEQDGALKPREPEHCAQRDVPAGALSQREVLRVRVPLQHEVRERHDVVDEVIDGLDVAAQAVHGPRQAVRLVVQAGDGEARLVEALHPAAGELAGRALLGGLQELVPSVGVVPVHRDHHTCARRREQ